MSAVRTKGLHHIAFRAKDYDRTVKLYEEAFGCVRKFGWGEPGSRAALMDPGDGNYIEIFEGRKDDPSCEGALIHFALRSANVDEDYARALAAGAEPHIAPKDATPANLDYPLPFRVAFVKGFDHEIVEFFQSEGL